jgi:hypothetical protein
LTFSNNRDFPFDSMFTVSKWVSVVDTPYPGLALPVMPNPLTDSAKQTIARSLDDMRELEAMDLYVEDGIGEAAGARMSETLP